MLYVICNILLILISIFLKQYFTQFKLSTGLGLSVLEIQWYCVTVTNLKYLNLNIVSYVRDKILVKSPNISLLLANNKFHLTE